MKTLWSAVSLIAYVFIFHVKANFHCDFAEDCKVHNKHNRSPPTQEEGVRIVGRLERMKDKGCGDEFKIRLKAE